MKILIDCVVTAADPAKCSSNIQFLTFVRRTLAARPDVFFYWLIPEWITAEQFDKTYPQDARVMYRRVPQHRDRTKEYLTVSRALDDAVAFNGSLWDFDVLLTMRTGLVPLLKLLMNSPRHATLHWLKEVWLIEEMPLMDFKKTVMTINADVQDRYTMEGYLAADHVYVLSYHEPPAIARRARDFFAPSLVREIEAKLHSVVTTQFSDYSLFPPDRFPQPGQPFCIAHSGRMEMANRIEEINRLMVNQFVMKGDKVRLLVTTVSSVVKEFDQSVVDVRHASRDEFWKLCKEEMHVFLKLSTEGGFTLALLEPMMFGVPAIIAREPWSIGLFGKDYPFFVANETQAYALVNLFHEDYPKMYAQWADWHVNVFRPLMERRFKTDLLYDLLDGNIEQFKQTRTKFAEKHPGKELNSFVGDVLAHVGTASEIVIPELIADMHKAGKVSKKMVDKLAEGDRDERGLVWSTAFNEYRVILEAFHGWTDASVKVGHLRRAG